MKNAKRLPEITAEILKLRVTKNGGTEVRTRLESGAYRTFYLPAGFAESELIEGNIAVITQEERIAGVTGYTDASGAEHVHGINPDSGELWEGVVKGDILTPGIVEFYSTNPYNKEGLIESAKRASLLKDAQNPEFVKIFGTTADAFMSLSGKF